MKVSSKLSFVMFALTLLFSLPDVSQAQGVIGEILKRIEEHQKSLSSFRSKITIEKYDSALAETDVYEGTTIYLRRRGYEMGMVRNDFTKPARETRVFVNGQYVFYKPSLRMAITGRIDYTGISELLLFANLSKRQIRDNYNISYLGQEKSKSGIQSWHLILKPKRDAVYKSVELWIDGNGMTVQAKVLGNNNDTTISLSDLKKNEALSPSDFPLALPKNTKLIRAGRNDCPCFKPDNARDALRYWSDAVFSGEITAVNGAHYTFKTERIWKGVINREVVVRNPYEESACAIKLEMAERYVVFARKSKLDGRTILSLTPCNFTTNIATDAGEKVLKEIGKGKPLKKAIVRKRQSVR